MKPVRLKESPKWPYSKAFVSLLLAIMLTACGANAATIPPSPGSTANTEPNALTALRPNASRITIDEGSLRIQSKNGLQCPSDPIGSGIGTDQLVLASNRTTYSQAEIAQMRMYVENNISSTTNFLAGNANPPPTLRWVLGTSIVPIPGVYFASCTVVLVLTNTGNTPIQIPQAGVQLKERPQQNLYQYRLIDACSLIPLELQNPGGGCAPPFGNATACSFYSALIQLGVGEKNVVFSAVPSATGPSGSVNCGILTIAPAAEVDLSMTFSLAAGTPKNLLYEVLPILTVDTTQGEQKLALSQMISTLAFADANQFSCYGLQGTIFVLEAPVLPTAYCM